MNRRFFLTIFVALLARSSARAAEDEKAMVVCFGDRITKRGYSELLEEVGSGRSQSAPGGQAGMDEPGRGASKQGRDPSDRADGG
ncbi:MAG: hypothetical protein QNL33_05060 [Akkermansiaceae bacterium]